MFIILIVRMLNIVTKIATDMHVNYFLEFSSEVWTF